MNKQCYAAAVGMFSIRFVSIFRLRTVGIIDTWVENKQQRIHITHTCRVTSHVLLRRVRRMQTGTCNCSRTTKVLYPQRAWKLPSGGAGGSESSGSGSRSSQQSNWQTYYIVDMTWQTPQGHNKPAMLAFDSVFRHTGPELGCIYVARCTLYAVCCTLQVTKRDKRFHCIHLRNWIYDLLLLLLSLSLLSCVNSSASSCFDRYIKNLSTGQQCFTNVKYLWLEHTL